MSAMINLIECCDEKFSSGLTYMFHLKKNHFKNNKTINNEAYHCVIDNCKKKYFSLFYLKQHLNKEHIEKLSQFLNFNSEFKLDNEMCESNDFEVGDEFFADEINEMEVEVSSFNVPQLPLPTFKNQNLSIDEEFSIILQQEKVKTKSTQAQINSISGSVLNFLNNDLIKNKESFDILVRTSMSSYLQEKQFNKIFENKEWVSKINQNGGELCVIDLRKTIEFILTKQHVVQWIFEDYFRSSNKDIISSYKDTIVYEKEKDENVICIYLDVYNDDFETKTNICSPKNETTNLSVIYYTIGNIQYKYQAKRDDILVSTIACKNQLKVVTIDNLFKPLINQLNELNQNKIKIGDYYLKFKIKAVPADNLALNKMAKVCASFIWDACRDCDVSFEDLIKFHSKTLTNNQVKERTLNENHVLKDAPYTTPELYPSDISHDLNEGIICEVMDSVLSKICKSKRKMLKDRIENDFKYLFKNGWVSGIVDKRISGNAMQKFDFFILFPIIFASANECNCSEINCNTNLFNTNEFKLYIQLRKLVDFCYSTYYEKVDLDVFEELVNRFLFNLAHILHHVTFKGHNMSHYKKKILYFGPLFFLNTLRYERLHQLLKSFTKNNKNFGSIVHQMAKQWVVHFISEGFKVRNKEDYFEVYNKEEIVNYIPGEYLKFINLDLDLSVLKFYILDSIRVEEGFVFLYKYCDQNSLPLFFKVRKIFKQDNAVKFLGYKIMSLEFIKNIYSFRVKQENNLIELNLSNLPFHDNLHLLKFKEESYIVKNFYIPERYSKFYD